MIEFPEEDYIQVEEDGKMATYATLRQEAMHVIGLDRRKPYTRHGKKFYRPYRNGWGGRNKKFDMLVDEGLMNAYNDKSGNRYFYHFSRAGLDWLGEQLGITIHDPED